MNNLGIELNSLPENINICTPSGHNCIFASWCICGTARLVLWLFKSCVQAKYHENVYIRGLPLITYASRGCGGVNTNAYKCVQGGRGVWTWPKVLILYAGLLKMHIHTEQPDPMGAGRAGSLTLGPLGQWGKVPENKITEIIILFAHVSIFSFLKDKMRYSVRLKTSFSTCVHMYPMVD